MSKGFEDWTEEDVIRHNQAIKMGAKNQNKGRVDIVSYPGVEKLKKISKYRNERVVVGGVKYDSKKEAKRAEQLEAEQRIGLITDLEKQKKYVLQPSFKFMGKTIREIAYVADFVYKEHGNLVVEDVKSPITRANPVYKIKKKMMLYVHGIEIKEV